VKATDTAAVLLPSGLMIHIENPGQGRFHSLWPTTDLTDIGFMQMVPSSIKAVKTAPRDMHFVGVTTSSKVGKKGCACFAKAALPPSISLRIRVRHTGSQRKNSGPYQPDYSGAGVRSQAL
jgi:hypothetical protein